jgi:hypothetical protein
MHVINKILSGALLGNTSHNHVHTHQYHHLHPGHREAVKAALSGIWSHTALNGQHCSCSRLNLADLPGTAGTGNTSPLASCEAHVNRTAEILQYDMECSAEPMNYIHYTTIVACVFIFDGTCLPSRCLAINVYSGSAIPAFRRHVTLLYYYTNEVCNMVYRNHSCLQPCTQMAVTGLYPMDVIEFMNHKGQYYHKP